MDQLACGDGRLSALGAGVWVASKQFTNESFTATSRMTVLKLADGRLVIHSPIALDQGLQQDVASLGEIVAIVAPNRFHHQFVDGWRRAFPAALVFGSPSLSIDQRDLRLDHLLNDKPPALWVDEIEQVAVEGLPTDEFVFFHRASRTLLVADFAFNYTPSQATADPGAADGLGPHDRHRTSITDAEALARTIRHILRWDFDRVVVSHGEVVRRNGRRLFAAGFAFLNEANSRS